MSNPVERNFQGSKTASQSRHMYNSWFGIIAYQSGFTLLAHSNGFSSVGRQTFSIFFFYVKFFVFSLYTYGSNPIMMF